jgi:uncharacterized protein YbaR (Trm112 family)
MARTRRFSNHFSEVRLTAVRAKPELTFDPAMAAQLACPACLGSLRCNATTLVCGSCGRAYPIVDGIPALIAERAEMPAQRKIPEDVG